MTSPPTESSDESTTLYLFTMGQSRQGYLGSTVRVVRNVEVSEFCCVEETVLKDKLRII
jgi:hypothetical protein